MRKSFQHTDAYAVDNIIGILEGCAAIKGSIDLDGESIRINISLAKLGYHGEVVLIDVRESNFNIL